MKNLFLLCLLSYTVLFSAKLTASKAKIAKATKCPSSFVIISKSDEARTLSKLPLINSEEFFEFENQIALDMGKDFLHWAKLGRAVTDDRRKYTVIDKRNNDKIDFYIQKKNTHRVIEDFDDLRSAYRPIQNTSAGIVREKPMSPKELTEYLNKRNKIHGDYAATIFATIFDTTKSPEVRLAAFIRGLRLDILEKDDSIPWHFNTFDNVKDSRPFFVDSLQKLVKREVLDNKTFDDYFNLIFKDMDRKLLNEYLRRLFTSRILDAGKERLFEEAHSEWEDASNEYDNMRNEYDRKKDYLSEQQILEWKKLLEKKEMELKSLEKEKDKYL